MKSRLIFSTLIVAALPLAALAQQGIARPILTPSPQTTPDPATSAPATADAASPTGVAPGTRPPTVAPRVTADYVLGPSDVIQINVWKEPNLTGSQVIRPDGMISLPLLGDVRAAGLTPMALSATIATRLKDDLLDPLVTVSVSETNSKRIYFIGEVQHPGPMALTPNMTFLEAVSSAGGLTPYANAKHIYILRGDKGNQQKIPFDYKKAVKSGNQQGVQLQSGDTIVVP